MILRVLALTAAIFSLPACAVPAEAARDSRARDLGILVGTLPAGRWNAITDVAGVTVGHQTIVRGNNIRTGVTAILPHAGNLFQEKIPGAIYVGNGYGKLSGYTQVEELGNIETPIILTNTLSVGTAMAAVVEYTPPLLHNDHMSPLFLAAMDATEEAIYNSLLQATTVHGHRGTIEAIPLDAVLRIWRK